MTVDGLIIDSGNGVELENDKETLLLTLKLNNCPDTIALINNTIDPFAQLPNSVSNNPGMDFETFNFFLKWKVRGGNIIVNLLSSD